METTCAGTARMKDLGRDVPRRRRPSNTPTRRPAETSKTCDRRWNTVTESLYKNTRDDDSIKRDMFVMKLNCVLTHGVCGRGVANWYWSGAQPHCKTDEVQIPRPMSQTKTTSPPFVNFEMMFWRHEEHPSSTISTKGLVQGAQQRQQAHSMDKKHHNLCLANVLAPQTVLSTLGSGFAQIPTTKR